MNIAKASVQTILFLTSVYLSSVVKADSSLNSHWQISLAVGAGVRTNPVMDNSNIPLIVIPQINYQYDRFFFQNLDFGYVLYEDNQQQVNLLLTPSYDQVFFNRWDVNNFVTATQNAFSSKLDSPTVDLVNHSIDKRNLHERRMAALAGLEYINQFGSMDFQLQTLHEITQYYSGDEVRIALGKNIDVGKNKIKLTAGINWQNDKTLNYFYGLSSQDAPSGDLYSPSSGITTLLRFDWNYQLNAHWSLQFLASYRSLANSITKSPLVTQDDVITAFAGGVYHF